MTKQATSPEPRSVRLTQAHRNDMINAVLREWEEQNPAPAQANDIELFKLIAKELKKHPVYKSTKRFMSVLEPNDLKSLHFESAINVQFVNKQGEVRNTSRYFIPFEMAESLGLQGVPESHAEKCGVDYNPDIHSLDNAQACFGADRDKTKPGERIVYLNLTMVNRDHATTIVLNDDSPGMAKRKESAKARKAWSDGANRLREETRDLLEQFNTTKQLREGWPDIVPYLPPHLADPERAVKLPVMATSRLSERLGIK